MNQKKENKERCDYIRKQLTEFYKTKYVSLENDRKRYRAKAQELIEKNDYILSVNTYLHEEIEEEEIDPIALENEARQLFLSKMKKELEFEKTVCEMEGISIQPFINAIRAVLEEYDTYR